jgi:hypothetical protein
VGGGRRAVAGLGAAALTLSGVAAIAGASLALGPGVAHASSHREAPLIAGNPRADNTDTYAFVSPDKSDTVTIIGDWIPFEEPNGGPNFYTFADGAHYNINIDNDGDGKADVVYTWQFTTHTRDAANQFLYNTGPIKKIDGKNLNVYQTYTLTKTAGGKKTTLVNKGIAAPSDVGPASVPDYSSLRQQAIKMGQLPGGGQSYAGQADDPFFLDLRVFDLLYGADLSEAGHDTLAGYNVNTLAIQVPKKELALKGDPKNNPVIGVWNTTDEQSSNVLGGGMVKKSGDYVQVSRLGNPLVNEVVVPLKYKDAFNSLPPSKDHTIMPVVKKVQDPIVPKLVQKIYGIPAPKTPRSDLVETFLTGVAKNAPTLNGKKPPIQADLNSQVLNKDVKKSSFVPAEEMRLNMSVPVTANPKRLGVLAGDLQGFPNGRRLTDDVVDIELQVVEGAIQNGLPPKLVKPLAAGDGVNTNDVAFSKSFPYVALPHNQSVNKAGQAGGSGSGSGGGAQGGQAATSGGGSGGGSGGTAGAGSGAGTPSGGLATGAGGTAGDGAPLTPLAAVAAGLVAVVGGGLLLHRRVRG